MKRPFVDFTAECRNMYEGLYSSRESDKVTATGGIW
jgi:hypothetical protein